MSSDWEIFYKQTYPPPEYESVCSDLRAWVRHHASLHHKMALVTSGGTTVPLERNTVRFLDNFSVGTRGAASCEHFLQHGYAVVFLHRLASVLPFARHLHPARVLDALASVSSSSALPDPIVGPQRDEEAEDDSDEHSMNVAPPEGTVLDTSCLTCDVPEGAVAKAPPGGVGPEKRARELRVTSPTQAGGNTSGNLKLEFDDSTSQVLRPVVECYRKAVVGGMLMSIPFSSLTSYLWYLKAACECLQAETSRLPAALYLAAAVADYYIPDEKLSEHKLESCTGPLSIELELVPKMLLPMVSTWSPSLYVVSFKLETDVTKLLSKAKTALQKYGHHLVVGNLLQTRREQVTLVEPLPSSESSLQTPEVSHVDGVEAVVETSTNFSVKTFVIQLSDDKRSSGVEIEERIVSEICSRHDKFIKDHLLPDCNVSIVK